VDGVDITPALRGRRLAARPLYWYMPLYDTIWAGTPCAVVRDGAFKLIEYFGDWFDDNLEYRTGNRLELYNLDDDIGERHDLASKLPAKASAMREQLHKWIRASGAIVPGENPNYDPARALMKGRRT
jgi:hypothetical protein